MPLTTVSIKNAADGRHGDGGGLELHKSGNSGKWIWRYSFAGKRREMGLGGWPSVGLAAARKERDRWARVLARGSDPITERKAEKAAALAEIERRDPTLEALARDVLAARADTLKGGGKAGRWISPLERHVFPRIGRKPVSEIHQSHIKEALAPIWRTKHPTAEKAVHRLRIVFRQGQLMGYNCDPFTVDAAIHMLGHVAHQPEHIPATPWQEVPALFEWLDGRGVSAACLQLMLLTAVRGMAARGARFDEIDGDIWTVPAERMKGRVGRVTDFRVPLTATALDLIEQRRQLGGTLLFPGPRGKPISDTSLSKFMSENGHEGRPHGFRTSFKTWVQDTDAASYEVSEAILAHVIDGKVQRAYARSDLLERRRPVMQAWADYVTGGAGNVVRLRG